MRAKAIVPPATEVKTEVARWGVRFTGTKHALIAKGICREEHFPVLPKRTLYSGEKEGENTPGEWATRRCAGGVFEFRAWDQRTYRSGSYWCAAWGKGSSEYQPPTWAEQHMMLVRLHNDIGDLNEWMRRSSDNRTAGHALPDNLQAYRKQVMGELDEAWWIAEGGEEHFRKKNLPASCSARGFKYDRDTYDDMLEHFEALKSLINTGKVEELPAQRRRIRLRADAADNMEMQIFVARMFIAARDNPLEEDAA